MSPAPPVIKEKPVPECYKPETNVRAWGYWLLPSRHDPRNALLASWAAWIEWMVVIAYQMVPPSGFGGYSFPDYSTLILIPGTFGMLACWGYRGMVSGYVRRTGSTILFFTNALPFLLYTVIVLSAWWQHR